MLFRHYIVSNSFVTPWTVALQAPLSMGFLRQEYWNGLPFPSAGVISDPGIKPASPVLQVDSLSPSHQGSLKGYLGKSSNLTSGLVFEF